MKILTEKDRQDIIRIISRPQPTQEALDNCPIMQESLRARREVAKERSRDPKKFDAESETRARALGIEIVDAPDNGPPWIEEILEKRRKRLAAEQTEQESRVPVPVTAKVLAE